MAISRNEIQKKSDKKRGVVSKGYKLKIETAELIKSLSEKTGMSQGEIIAIAVSNFEKSLQN